MRQIETISVSEQHEIKVRITSEMHEQFAELSGDNSPIHIDPEFARANGFPNVLGYAFLLTTLLSRMYGTIFPGGSELCLQQDCKFPNPYFVDDELLFSVTVTHKNDSAKLLVVKTTIHRQNDTLIFRGKGQFQLSLNRTEKLLVI